MAESATAGQLKSRGDTAYSEQNITKARKLYAKALVLDPLSITLHSNLSAALFELGDYTACIESIETALRLLDGAESPLVPKLQFRLARSFAALKRTDDACNTLSQLEDLPKDHPLKVQIIYLKRALESIRDHAKVSADVANLRLVQSPLFRPSIKIPPDYFVVGQETPFSVLASPHRNIESDVEAELRSAVKQLKILIPQGALQRREDWNFSALFIGSGDARHVFSTFIDIGKQIGKFIGPGDGGIAPSTHGPKIHLTLIDIHPSIIARSLVIFHALDDLAKFTEAERKTSKDAIELLCKLHFLCWAVVMPKSTHRIMMNLIQRVRNNPTLPWLTIDPESLPAIENSLDWWLSAPAAYSTRQMMAVVGPPRC